MLFLLCLVSIVAASFDRGFNSGIDWTNNLPEALVRASNENKPAFVLIHKTWCGACKRLKTVFSDSVEILHRSKDFVMVWMARFFPFFVFYFLLCHL
jgi:hypothetical protein